MTTTDTTIETGSLSAFLATGDVANLMPLADYFAETDRETAAQWVRHVIAGHTDKHAVRFFLEHGWRSGDIATSFRNAVGLADAEAWFDALEADGEASCDWEVDPDASYEAEQTDDSGPRELYGCVVTVTVNGEEFRESLWSIDLDTSRPFRPDPYARAVEAELKAELRRRLS